MASKKIPVVELFGPVVQGEGALCGQVSYFLRTGNCGYRCTWCDSLHAVLPKQVKKNSTYMHPEDIVEAFVGMAPPVHRETWVTLSGGDPVIWDLEQVIIGLHLRGFRVAVETQAALWQDWLEMCDLVTASPKGPSSGMEKKFKPEILQKYVARLGDRLVIKVVAFDDADLEFAARLHKWQPQVKFFLSSGTPAAGPKSDNKLPLRILDGYRELTEKVLKMPEFHDATILPQVHALVYGRELGR